MTKQTRGKLKRITSIAALLLISVLFSSCGKKEADAPDILMPQEESGTIAPEEVTPEDMGEPAPAEGSGEAPPADPAGDKAEGEAAADPAAPNGAPLQGVLPNVDDILADSSGSTDGSPASDNGRRVVYLILPSDTGFSAVERERITDNLKARGYSVAVRVYDDVIERQSVAFDEVIRLKPAAIVCDNTYGDETRASVQAAHEAGVPTFLMDQGIDLSGVAQGQLVVDRCGRVSDLAEYFAGQSDEPVNYVALGGCEEDSRSLDMMDLIERELDRYVQVTCLAEEIQPSYDKEDAEERIKALFKAFPEADTLICYNVLQTEAGLVALDELGIKDRVRVLCVSGDRDAIVTMINHGDVEAAIVEPAEILADMVSDDVVRFFKTGSPEWSERRYVMASILTRDGVWDPETARDEKKA